MKSTRRIPALVAFLLLLFASHFLYATKRPIVGPSYLVYVGTYTGFTSKGIYSFRFDPVTGRATKLELAAETKDPSFLAVDPSAHFLYAVNEISDYQGQHSGAVSAFSIDATSGKLAFLNQVSSQGAGPCYVALDKTGKYVLVANYDSGTLSVFPTLKEGTLGEASAVVQHMGHGADPERQRGPHAHQIELSPDNRFAIAADLGLDKLLIYRFDPTKGTLEANSPAFAQLDPGSGPRHFAFTPNGKFAYVLEELRSAIAEFAYDANRGSLRRFETISSVPKTFTGRNDAAEIVVDPSGKFVYASNRGHDSIAVFAVGHRGRLKVLEYVPTQGKTPRGFAIDPTGSYLFVGNQGSNNVIVFRIDPSSGQLKTTDLALEVPTPVAVTFVPLK